MVELAVPQRISWAAEQLDLDGGEIVLEVGCGRGVAAELIGQRLTHGRLMAIDRSAAATQATLARAENRPLIDARKLEVVTVALADLEGFDAAFDIVFAVNVNVFWLDPTREMAVIRRVLKPGGVLQLFYEPPSMQRAREIRPLLSEMLVRHGFVAERVSSEERLNLLHLQARRD